MKTKNNMIIKHSLYCLLLVVGLSSCSSSNKVVYFQDMTPMLAQEVLTEGSCITIAPHDQISVVVSSKNPELAALVNLPRIQQTVGMPDKTYNGQPGQILGYTVGEDGDIDFPLLGSIHVQGLTREEVAGLIKEKLREDLVKDAVVTVEFQNLGFSVMGEVGKPGRYSIDKDRVTILDALSMAGDLTIYGQRDKVYLIRTDGKRTTYQLDLRSADIFNSPAFYVKQNDVIYVEPNGVKANQSTINGNNVRSVSLWMSIASFLTTVGVLIFK